MIEVIRAEEKHVTAIGKLWWELIIFHQNIDDIFTPKEGAVISFEENYLRRLMKSTEGLVMVALDGIKVVGYSIAEIQTAPPSFRRDKYGHSSDMVITASHRRKGIGEKMLSEILKWFQSKNIKRVELGIAAGNQMAWAFWNKQGFKVYRHTLYSEIK